MRMNRNCALPLLLLFSGCASSQLSVRIDGLNSGWRTATTHSKYHIAAIRSRNPELERTLKEAGGVNASLPSGWTYTPAQIRGLERLAPAVFDEDGIPVDIDIEMSSDSGSSLWKLPYYLLCGCSLCTVPCYHAWSDTSRYRVKVSTAPHAYEFSAVQKHEGCWSLLGLNCLVPFSPLENADCKYDPTDTAAAGKRSSLIVQAIVSALQASEGSRRTSKPRRIGRTIGD